MDESGVRGEMYGTGVFITPQENAYILRCMAEHERITKASKHRKLTMKEVARAQQLVVQAQLHAHKAALRRGLPDIEGYYGVSAVGEFIGARKVTASAPPPSLPEVNPNGIKIYRG